MKILNLLRAFTVVLILGAAVPTNLWAQEEETLTPEQEAAEALNQKVFNDFITQEGVIKRSSGLYIKIITKGDGGLINPRGQALVHYEGKLADGTVFDSSYKRGQPNVIPVQGVIKGWQEALLLMQIGSKWEVAIPADIGYGKDGQRGIPPGANLFFTIELLGQR